MPFARTALRLTIFIVAFSASVALAGDIGQEIANQVSVASYQHYLGDLLYTHDGNDRDAVGGLDHDAARDNIVATLQGFGLGSGTIHEQ